MNSSVGIPFYKPSDAVRWVSKTFEASWDDTAFDLEPAVEEIEYFIKHATHNELAGCNNAQYIVGYWLPIANTGLVNIHEPNNFCDIKEDIRTMVRSAVHLENYSDGETKQVAVAVGLMRRR